MSKVLFFIGIALICYNMLMLLMIPLMTNKLRPQFICKSCNKLNKIVANKCMYCGKPLSSHTLLFKSMFPRKVNCKDADGNLSYDLIKKNIQIELWLYTIFGLFGVILMILSRCI